MSGNVWEWTRSLWGKDWRNPDFKYPYRFDDDRENLDADDDHARVVRGGSFFNLDGDVRAAIRYWSYPHYRLRRYGFRVVFSPFTTEH
jgi:formylglycine-generating enzyme required for sulfatase activity